MEMPIGYRWLPSSIVVKHHNIMLKVTRVGEYILRKQGYMVMQIAKGLIKDAAGLDDHGAPGHPPKSHTGKLRRMEYVYRRDSNSVLVGPKPFVGSTYGEALSLLEFGGHTTVPTAEMQWKTRDGKPVMEQPSVATNLLPRPYMGPALEEAKPQLAAFWQNAMAA
jgi:hypothetical protein